MSVLLAPITVLYVLASSLCFRALRLKQTIASKALYASAGSALCLQALWLAHQLFYGEGQDLSIFNVASILSLFIGAAVTSLARPFKLWFVLPVVYLVALITLLLAQFSSPPYIIHLELRPQVLIHIAFALAAFTIMAIASLYALQMSYISWSLKSHKAMAIHPALPSLLVIERQLFGLITLGFALLSFSLLSGFVFINDIFASGRGHKALFSLLAWIVYGVLLWGHHMRGWRGHIVSVLTFSGLGLLTLAYFGSRIVRELILR